MNRRVGYGLAVVAGLAVVYYAIPPLVAITSLGEICPYSPLGTNMCPRSASTTTHIGKLPPGVRTTFEPAGATLCRKSGIRYAGTTTAGAEVCFTLSSDRLKWTEVGFRFTRASRCPVPSGNGFTTGDSYYEGPEPLTEPGRIVIAGFTATIHAARAEGVVGDSKVCGSKTFRWTALRVQ
jgi:hypothetical protein